MGSRLCIAHYALALARSGNDFTSLARSKVAAQKSTHRQQAQSHTSLHG
jgi:hypothetical protein